MQPPDPHSHMHVALDAARSVRLTTAPNPWVGCVLVCADGQCFVGATEPPGRRHAERVALEAAHEAGADTRHATAYTTLEPCSHHGRTPPCTDALIHAGIARVVSAIADPDPQVTGAGFARLRQAGVEVDVGEGAEAARELLAPYLHHRRTGRPLVVLKLAATIDGRSAAPDGTSQWITSLEARSAVHRLRAESGAVLVGSGTVRADDPSLTVRLVDGPDPRRVVLGSAPPAARVHPCLQWDGPLLELLQRLGDEGVLQLLVEGGPKVAASFHRERLVDRYVIHLAPALMGGDDGMSIMSGLGTPTIAGLWRGRITTMRTLGPDLELVLVPQETP